MKILKALLVSNICLFLMQSVLQLQVEMSIFLTQLHNRYDRMVGLTLGKPSWGQKTEGDIREIGTTAVFKAQGLYLDHLSNERVWNWKHKAGL